MSPSTSKIAKAPANINQKIVDLLTIVSGAPALTMAQNKSLAKLYELVVLEDALRSYVSSTFGRTVRAVSAAPGVLHFAGAPAMARKGVHSYFELVRDGVVEYEAWISVEVTTLSWEIHGKPSLPRAAKHEIDVGIFSVLDSAAHYPSYRELCVGYSCKHCQVSKENVREALGLRRETAYLRDPTWSKAEWICDFVRADPASPIILASSSPRVLSYSSPLEEYGLFMEHIPFPP